MKLTKQVMSIYEANGINADKVAKAMLDPDSDNFNQYNVDYLDLSFDLDSDGNIDSVRDMGDCDFVIPDITGAVWYGMETEEIEKDEVKRAGADIARHLNGKKFEFKGKLEVNLVGREKGYDSTEKVVLTLKIKKASYDANKDSMKVECEIINAQAV